MRHHGILRNRTYFARFPFYLSFSFVSFRFISFFSSSLPRLFVLLVRGNHRKAPNLTAFTYQRLRNKLNVVNVNAGVCLFSPASIFRCWVSHSISPISIQPFRVYWLACVCIFFSSWNFSFAHRGVLTNQLSNSALGQWNEKLDGKGRKKNTNKFKEPLICKRNSIRSIHEMQSIKFRISVHSYRLRREWRAKKNHDLMVIIACVGGVKRKIKAATLHHSHGTFDAVYSLWRIVFGSARLVVI